MKKADIEEFYRRLSEANPEPKGELNYKNATPWWLLSCCQRKRPMSVNKATKELFKIVDTPEKMLKLGERKLKSHIKTIGLYNAKAKNVMKLSKLLVDNFDSTVPQDREALKSLPGVGRKTANVVLNIFFGEPTIAVDTHLFRLGNRLGIAPGKTPLEVEKKFEKNTPAKYMRHAHHWLILHGRYVCKARKPDCPACVVNDLCKFKGKTTA